VIKPTWAIAGVAFLGITGGIGVLIASSGGEEELLQQVATPTPGASATPAASSTAKPEPTVTPAASAPPSLTVSSVPSLPPISEGWTLDTQPASTNSPAFTFAYPTGWFKHGGTTADGSDGTVAVYSFDPVAWGKPSSFPPESTKFEVAIGKLAGLSRCGPEDGIQTTLFGLPAKQNTETYDPPHPSGLTESVWIAASDTNYCFNVTASFAQKAPDETTFSKFVQSLRLAN